jgi:hypothetical protein
MVSAIMIALAASVIFLCVSFTYTTTFKPYNDCLIVLYQNREKCMVGFPTTSATGAISRGENRTQQQCELDFPNACSFFLPGNHTVDSNKNLAQHLLGDEQYSFLKDCIRPIGTAIVDVFCSFGLSVAFTGKIIGWFLLLLGSTAAVYCTLRYVSFILNEFRRHCPVGAQPELSAMAEAMEDLKRRISSTGALPAITYPSSRAVSPPAMITYSLPETVPSANKSGTHKRKSRPVTGPGQQAPVSNGDDFPKELVRVNQDAFL